MTRKLTIVSLLIIVLFAFATGCGSKKEESQPVVRHLSPSEAQFLAATYSLCLDIVNNTSILGNAMNGNLVGRARLIRVIENSQKVWLTWEGSNCPSKRMKYLWLNCKKLSRNWSQYTFAVGQYLLGRDTIEDLFSRLESVMDTLTIIQSEIERNGSGWGIPEGNDGISV